MLSATTGRRGAKKATYKNRASQNEEVWGLRGTAVGDALCRGHAHHGSPKRFQHDPTLPVVYQSPQRRAIVTQPVVLDTPRLLPGPHKRRRDRLSRPGHAIRLHQKQFALSKFEERLAAFWIGALAEHFLDCFLLSGNGLAEPWDFQSRARRVPLSFPSPDEGSANSDARSDRHFPSFLPTNRQSCRPLVEVSLPSLC